MRSASHTCENFCKLASSLAIFGIIEYTIEDQALVCVSYKEERKEKKQKNERKEMKRKRKRKERKGIENEKKGKEKKEKKEGKNTLKRVSSQMEVLKQVTFKGLANCFACVCLY